MSTTTRTRRPQGPIIDQDGFEVSPETIARERAGSGGPDFSGGAFDPGFGAKGFEGIRIDAASFGAPLTHEQRLARLDMVAQLLDVAFVLPGTKVRYGIDGLIGLIPIVGDILTTAIALWVVREARALGAPRHLVARMLANVALDSAVGIVPVVGDAFDVMFRANMRNVRLLRRWLDKQATRR